MSGRIPVKTVRVSTWDGEYDIPRFPSIERAEKISLEKDLAYKDKRAPPRFGVAVNDQ